MNHYLPPHSLQTAGIAAVKFRPDLADGLPGRKKGNQISLVAFVKPAGYWEDSKHRSLQLRKG